ncbi:class I SAM-dependent methyltransferase [Aestuariirhabdus sp. Z084]|uniref:O-methyltransferase n=1 Tax=Aestuariirhabdus haliotis TaxID=2918751 RepID=UPI00201B3E65|nr:class I SAM-dependent methyltransferase [Aestuariirhabdus haliotis]MCL6417316.1 class I SAM-dependent methyltransferase [Aestuariirhabdus haliotis]MCL6421261.1 class I SAM-dependent methyltransferase [Aestuariirhabdus haliotis]
MPDHLVHPDIERYCSAMTSDDPALLQELIDATNQEMAYPIKLSGKLVGRTLNMLTRISGARNILEIGMFTGYSALSMAEALPDGGRIICCESNPRAIKFAQSFFDRSPHGKKIEVRFGKALDTIESLQPSFDLVFIDADKRNYFNYLKATLPLVNSGGLIIIDNALWQGQVLDPQDEKDRAIDEMNQFIHDSDLLENCFLSVRDGLNVVRKR